jgi:phosphatidylglycerophosphate synthase
MENQSISLQEYKRTAHATGALWVTMGYQSLAAYLAYFAGRIGMSPNSLTLISGLCVLLSMGVLIGFGVGSLYLALLVFVLLALAYVFDCADGQLARTTNQCSKFGAWLDHVSDASKIFVIHGSIGWVLLESHAQHGVPIALCFLAVLLHMAGASLYFFAWNYKVMLVGADMISSRQADRKSSLTQKLRGILQLTDHGLFLLLFILLFDPQKFALAYFLYGAGTFVIFMAYIVVSGSYMAKLKD